MIVLSGTIGAALEVLQINRVKNRMNFFTEHRWALEVLQINKVKNNRYLR